MLFYLCTDLEEPSTPATQDEDEDVEPRTFTLDEAWAMVERGEIADLQDGDGADPGRAQLTGISAARTTWARVSGPVRAWRRAPARPPA